MQAAQYKQSSKSAKDKRTNENIKGWQPTEGNTININVWLDALTDDQQRLTKEAFKEWVGFSTANGSLGKSNFEGANPARKNRDVMSDEALQAGTSGRNLTDTDIAGMKKLYDGKTFNFQYVNDKDKANITVEITEELTTEGKGGWNCNANGEVTSGYVKLPANLGNIGGTNPPIPGEWFYAVDSDKDDKITNSNKDGTGKLIKEHKYCIQYGGNLGRYVFTHVDFYSLVKHEIGHPLGFVHSRIIPEPSPLFLLGFGLAGVIGFGRKRILKKA